MLWRQLFGGWVGALTAFVFVASAAAQGTPQITLVEPAAGTEGTEFLVTGSDLGTALPKFFFSLNGEKLGGTKLRSLEFVEPEGDAPAQVLVRVDRAVTGSFQLGVKVKGKLPVVSDVAFEVLAPKVTSLEPFLASAPGHYTLEVDNATTAGAQVHFGTRRAKILSFTPLGGATSQLLVRAPKLAPSTWDVSFRSRVGQSVLHQALVVSESSVSKLGPKRMLWSADGPAQRSRGGRFTTTVSPTGLFRVTGRARDGDATLRMIVEIPETTLDAFTEPVVLSAFESGAVFVRTPKQGGSTVYLSDDFAALDTHSVFLNAVTETQIALSFFSTVTKQVGASGDPDELFVEGTLIVRR